MCLPEGFCGAATAAGASSNELLVAAEALKNSLRFIRARAPLWRRWLCAVERPFQSHCRIFSWYLL
jgi:hypothetical protein